MAGDPRASIDEADDVGELAGGRLAGIRATADPAYGPLVVLGGLAQVVAVFVQHVPLVLVGFAVGALADLFTADERNEVRGRLRRFGIGVLQRAVFRLLLVYAVLLPSGVPLPVVIAVTIGVLAFGFAARVAGWALGKVVRERPAMPAANLGAELPLAGVIERLRARRLLLVGLLTAAELPLVAALALGHLGADLAGLMLAAATTVAVLVPAGWSLLWARRLLRSSVIDDHVAALRAAIADTGARIVLYFSGDQASTYQLNQWLPVVERLDEPVLVVLREEVHVEQLAPTRHPMIICRRHRDVEVVLACDPRVALYVSTAGRNIHLLRYGRPLHVFLNHGDSDKISSANPVVKVYDRLFVAGELAIERYHAAGVDLPDDHFEVVGRPQLDRVTHGERAHGGPRTVLYAPTWEGFFEAADYSSVERQGPALIRRLLAEHPELRVVFKPHPASGTVRPAAAAAVAEVSRLLREAGGNHVLANDHPELDLLDWFDQADVLIADISAVVTDFLATGRPYLVTNPRRLSIEEFRERFPSHHAAYVLASDLSDLPEHLEAALGPDPLADDREQMRRRVLGDTPDGPFAAFEQALQRVLADAEQRAERVVNTFSYD